MAKLVAPPSLERVAQLCLPVSSLIFFPCSPSINVFSFTTITISFLSYISLEDACVLFFVKFLLLLLRNHKWTQCYWSYVVIYWTQSSWTDGPMFANDCDKYDDCSGAWTGEPSKFLPPPPLAWDWNKPTTSRSIAVVVVQAVWSCQNSNFSFLCENFSERHLVTLPYRIVSEENIRIVTKNSLLIEGQKCL